MTLVGAPGAVTAGAPPEPSKDPVVEERVVERRRPTGPVPLIVLLVGLVVVGVLTWASWQSYQDNEHRLLVLKAREAGTILTTATSSVQTPLAAAAELADISGGDPQQFDRFMAPYVAKGGSYVSASLWRLDDPAAGPLATLGAAPELAANQQAAVAFFTRASKETTLAVQSFVNATPSRLGYEYHVPGLGPYATYVEANLVPGRRAAVDRNSAFSDLHYAIYLGSATKANLLASDVAYPLTSANGASITVPFGDADFTFVARARGTLGGSLTADLPWVIAIAGTALALLSALVAEWLQRRRKRAEHLADELDRLVDETRNLYTEQRSVAQALEHALLPDRLPQPRGLEASCVYEPGTRGVEIGGDWYDLVPLGDDKAFFLVGDVSGRGVEAAAVMARLRFAALAYIQVGDPPEVILQRLSRLVSIEEYGHFATVVCGVVDVPGHTLTLANAGHPAPLMISGGTAAYVSEAIGPPVGVTPDPTYTAGTVSVPAGATLLMFTDGLVERRGEAIDEGMRRLETKVLENDGLALPALLATVVEETKVAGLDDDAAILGIRWQT